MSNFKEIHTINDVRPFVEDRPEIRFYRHDNGITIGCYLFQDSDTFSSPESLECRGIAFNEEGQIVSRPLHKFFNVGEKTDYMPDILSKKTLVGVFEKIDGSMIATCIVPLGYVLRSKSSFESDVANWATEFVAQNPNYDLFCKEVAKANWTAVFEYLDPRQPIVVVPSAASLTLLHIRDNVSGEYLTMQKNHEVFDLIKKYNIPLVKNFKWDFNSSLDELVAMENMEGYVFQFSDGSMAKAKCDWYLRRHRAITFLRKRDVALWALHGNLDDTKAFLREMGVDISKVEEIERNVRDDLVKMWEEIDAVCEEDKDLSKKDFAIKHKNRPLFGFMVRKREGRDFDLNEFYEKKYLKDRFSLEVLVNQLQEENKDGLLECRRIKI